MELGARLRLLREKKGLTQTEFASRMKMPNQNVSNYERGFRQPDYETLQKLARYFNVTTDYLLGMTDIPNAESEEFKEYLNDPLTSIAFKNFEGLSEEQKQEAIEMIKFIKFKESQKEQ